MSTQSVEIIPAGKQAELAAAFLPVMQIQHAVQRYNSVLQFTQEIMRQGKDYGVIPGVEKPSLLKPGAEKLCSFFGLTPRFVIVKETEQWEGDEPFFYYWYKCQLWRGDLMIAEGDGSCNSRESKYRYRWVNEDQLPPGAKKDRYVSRGGRISEFDFAIDKAETTGKYGKPASYWQAFKTAIENGTATRVQKKLKDGTRPGWEIDSTVYRVPNPDVSDQVNTIQKMAQKRALIAATLIACNASEYYTQDIEDMDTIDVPYTAAPVEQQKQPPKSDPPQPQQGAQSMTLDQVLATFTNVKVINEAFSQMREHFLKYYPEDVYEQIMSEHGLGPNEQRTAGKCKKAFAALWNTYRKAADEMGPIEEPME